MKTQTTTRPPLALVHARQTTAARTGTPRKSATGSVAAALWPKLLQLEEQRPDSLRVVEGYVNHQLGIARRLQTLGSRSE